MKASKAEVPGVVHRRGAMTKMLVGDFQPS